MLRSRNRATNLSLLYGLAAGYTTNLTVNSLPLCVPNMSSMKNFVDAYLVHLCIRTRKIDITKQFLPRQNFVVKITLATQVFIAEFVPYPSAKCSISVSGPKPEYLFYCQQMPKGFLLTLCSTMALDPSPSFAPY